MLSKYGNECVSKSIASVAEIQCNTRESGSFGIIHAAVISNFKLFIFCTDDCKRSASQVRINIVKPMYYVNFASQCLTKGVLDSIATAFSTASLKMIRFIDCDFEGYNILLILNLAKQIKTLKYFILNSFRMSEEALNDIAEIICNNVDINFLDLSNSNLSGLQLFIIVKALSKLSFLQHLDFSSNNIIDEAAVDIARVIAKSTSLKYLNLSCCDISDVGIEVICHCLNSSDSMKTVGISSEKIAPTLSYYDALQNLNSEPLAEMICGKTFSSRSFLCSDSVIEYLNLSDCNLSEYGVMLILRTVRNIKGLKYLNLHRNGKAEIALASLMRDTQEEYNFAYLKCIATQSGSLQSRIVAVISNLVLSIFLLSHSSKYESWGTIKPMYYVNLRCHLTTEVKDCIMLAFSTTHVLYFNFENYDLKYDNTSVVVQAVEHIDTLQYLILKSGEIHKKALDNIVILICNNAGLKPAVASLVDQKLKPLLKLSVICQLYSTLIYPTMK